MAERHPKIAINLLGWNHPPDLIFGTIESVLAQDYADLELWYTDNGSTNFLVDAVREKFAGQALGDHPRLKIVDNGKNLGYAGGHNKFFDECSAELLMVLNPDARLAPDFVSNIVRAFDDPKVGAATGKMLRPEQRNGEWLLDGTGIVVNRARRGRERGQLEVDHGQYDSQLDVFGVSGTAAVFRKSALHDAALPAGSMSARPECFDEDFFAYWEDLDLSWRLRLLGYTCRYVPGAVVYHERVASSSEKGYKNPLAFYRHHAHLSKRIRQWNWRNHLFAIVKNDFGSPLATGFLFILGREVAMLGWILIFEPSTLGAVPEFFWLLPTMLRKRRVVQERRRAAGVQGAAIAPWFNGKAERA